MRAKVAVTEPPPKKKEKKRKEDVSIPDESHEIRQKNPSKTQDFQSDPAMVHWSHQTASVEAWKKLLFSKWNREQRLRYANIHNNWTENQWSEKSTFEFFWFDFFQYVKKRSESKYNSD